ncbi:MAG: response regulator [bacterium]|nr:response regulator [bacterium]
MQILIAEDDTISREVLRLNLIKWGHDVIACKDGDEAWQHLQCADAPRLAILDWMMPGMEGTEICRRIRELPHGQLSYLMLLTAKERNEFLVEGLAAGADDYITKPFQTDVLRARLGVGLRVVELQARLREAERNRVLTQAAGAAAHEINQPLTVLLGTAQILTMQLPKDDPNRTSIEDLFRAAKKIDEIVKKMAQVRRYATQPYIEGIDIVDFEAGIDDPSKTNPP